MYLHTFTYIYIYLHIFTYIYIHLHTFTYIVTILELRQWFEVNVATQGGISEGMYVAISYRRPTLKNNNNNASGDL